MKLITSCMKGSIWVFLHPARLICGRRNRRVHYWVSLEKIPRGTTPYMQCITQASLLWYKKCPLWKLRYTWDSPQIKLNNSYSYTNWINLMRLLPSWQPVKNGAVGEERVSSQSMGKGDRQMELLWGLGARGSCCRMLGNGGRGERGKQRRRYVGANESPVPYPGAPWDSAQVSWVYEVTSESLGFSHWIMLEWEKNKHYCPTTVRSPDSHLETSPR